MAFGKHPGIMLKLLASFLFVMITAKADSLSFTPPAALDDYLAAHPISVKSVNQTNSGARQGLLQQSSATPNFTRSLCPVSCADAGIDSSSWTAYHDLNRLSFCNQSMLVDFALFNPLYDDDTHVTLYACSSAVEDTTETNGKSCPTLKHSTSVNSTLELTWSGSNTAGSTDTGASAVQQLQSYTQAKDSCDEEIAFAYSKNTVVGLYAGSGANRQNLIGPLLEEFLSYVQSNSISGTLAAQLCVNNSAKYSLGVVLNTDNDWSSVQEAVQTWSNASCVVSYGESSAWSTINYLVPASASDDRTSNSTALNGTLSTRGILRRDTTCTTAKIASGDTCTTVAAECGITLTEFEDYNSDLCSAPLTVGAYACCSSGSLPDNTPSAYSNGTCYTYTTQANDTCSALAASYDITVDDIENWNNDTWGWMGCSDVLIGMNICLSSGSAPMPTIISNAVCGPQVNGTAVAPAGTDLSTLNECPLNACCDIWGQCGTTTEFCTESNSTTGAPGTAAANQNGCISNCGSDIIYSDAPSEFFKIAYFEGYDYSRPCLAGNIMEFDVSGYTHIHLAFATLNSDFSVNVSSMGINFDLFASISGPKRILSFGGWDFSTDPSTYDIFRQAVSSEDNRQTTVTNIINFLNEYAFDGVDIDWEYPGEPDIPDIPADTDEDADYFYLFLVELKAAISSSMTVSITTPASYWYLKAYPIEAISKYVDYIVYMTYDLHGQWDYGKEYSDPGCTGGNCLRSDVNLTETLNALSMITKAGVPSNMVVVGVASYGRSFQMTTPGCYTEMCTYTGPDSGAIPGPCTNTAGYLGNGEINDIIAQNSSGLLQYTDDSYSDIVVYDDDQWVSYMTDENKEVRSLLYELLTFKGTVDWALDLQSNGTEGAGETSSTNDTGSGVVYVPPSIWTDEDPTLECIPPCSFIMPPLVLTHTTTVTIPSSSVVATVSSSTSITTTLGTKTTVIASYIPMTIPVIVPIPEYVGTTIPVWGIPIYSGSESGTITQATSIQPSPVPFVITPVWNGTTNIISGTTSTQTATTVIWGEYTWINSQQIHVWGGSTEITGGITGPPVTSTLTPGPYPQTVSTTPDPTLNSRTTTYKSQAPTSTCTSGCGGGCKYFCDPSCPFCPPGFGGLDIDSGGFCCGGQDDDNGGGDDDTSTETDKSTSSGSSSTSSSSSAIGTILAPEIVTVDPAITTAGTADFAAMNSAIASAWNSMYPASTSVTTTSVSTKATTTSTKTTKTTSTTSSETDWPTNTAINVGSGYCFTESMGYNSFSLTDAQAVVKSFCDQSYVLEPDNTYGQVEEYDTGSIAVVASAAWADSQSGCGTMAAWSFADSDEDYDLCLDAFSTDFFCKDEEAAATSSYGGGYVYKTGSGCILMELYAYTPT